MYRNVTKTPYQCIISFYTIKIRIMSQTNDAYITYAYRHEHFAQWNWPDITVAHGIYGEYYVQQTQH